ncbi:MAG: hypothetical protein AB2541_06950, partial [Candidatus Thiodiazotropha sp.]
PQMLNFAQTMQQSPHVQHMPQIPAQIPPISQYPRLSDEDVFRVARQIKQMITDDINVLIEQKNGFNSGTLKI